jgi:hypothetical protein
MNLGNYTEDYLKRNHNYVAGSLSRTTSENMVTITYEYSTNTSKNALIGTGAGAGVAAGSGAAIGFAFGGPIGALAGGAIGFFSGAGVGGGVGFAIPENEKFTKYFDANSGDYLGETKEQAVARAISKGIEKFRSQNFSNARDLFQAAYYHSPNGSYEEKTGQVHRIVTDSLIEGMSLIKNESYAEGKEKIMKAYLESSNREMKAVISSKRDELAEKLNSDALNNFQAGNWSKAEELFNNAYMLCTDGYRNENTFKNRRTVASKMKSISASNEVADLKDALNATSDSSMRSVIENRLKIAKKNAADK